MSFLAKENRTILPHKGITMGRTIHNLGQVTAGLAITHVRFFRGEPVDVYMLYVTKYAFHACESKMLRDSLTGIRWKSPTAHRTCLPSTVYY